MAYSTVSLIGAELQNLLKLFEAIINDELSNSPTISAISKDREHIIY